MNLFQKFAQFGNTIKHQFEDIVLDVQQSRLEADLANAKKGIIVTQNFTSVEGNPNLVPIHIEFDPNSEQGKRHIAQAQAALDDLINARSGTSVKPAEENNLDIH